jgi:hypothetical protein
MIHAFGAAPRIILLKSVALAMPRFCNNPNQREYDDIRCLFQEFRGVRRLFN